MRCNVRKEHGLWVLTPLGAGGDPAARGPVTAASPPGSPPTRQEPQILQDPPGQPGPPIPRASRPPAAWVWDSPHGATGISPTPPLLIHHRAHPSTGDDGDVPEYEPAAT